MDYVLHGSMTPMIEIKLHKGEKIYSQCGAMQWIDDGIEMKSSREGSFLESVKRLFVEDGKIFTDCYTTDRECSSVVLGHSYPGRIHVFDIEDKALICQKRLLLCVTGGVQYGVHLIEKNGMSFFGAEGFVLSQFVGVGKIVIHMDGDCVERKLAVGESVRVDPGSVGVFEETVTIKKQEIKGVPRVFRGEGGSKHLYELTGPGKVWLQASPIQDMAKELSKYLPSRPDPR